VPVGGAGRATITWTRASAGARVLSAYSQRADGTQSATYYYEFTVN
jgi:hypothetical protein